MNCKRYDFFFLQMLTRKSYNFFYSICVQESKGMTEKITNISCFSAREQITVFNGNKGPLPYETGNLSIETLN